MIARLLAAVFVVAALAGCSHRHDEAHAGHEHHGHAALAAEYKAGHGVRLGETAAAFAGLRIGEVETRDLPGAPGAAVVPAAALLRTVRGDFVFVENGGLARQGGGPGWLLRTPVTVGATDGGWVEVREGLYEGDRVAVAGVDALWLAEISAINGGVGCADGH